MFGTRVTNNGVVLVTLGSTMETGVRGGCRGCGGGTVGFGHVISF